MPILAFEIDVYPENLFELAEQRSPAHQWWALYTISRREKDLMRRLHAMNVAFFAPTVPRHARTPSGRPYTVYDPLFKNYVFLFGTEDARYAALTTKCVSKCVSVVDHEELTKDLKQLHRLIGMDVPLSAEAKLGPGQRVRIKSGRFRGFEGTIVRRENESRLLVAVNFLQQGASFLLDTFDLEPN